MLRGRRDRWWQLLVACVLCCLPAFPAALAETIEIDTAGDPASRLEIRNYLLPDGSEATLYILEAHPVTIRIGEQVLTANQVEVDLTRREIRVIGPGTYFNGSERAEGTDLIIGLAEETFQSRDVLIMTDAMDIIGTDAYRVPGQISVTDGYFSPCSRCGQVVDDYGFRAGRIELFPGDRLVAFDVTMLVRGRDIVSLPLLVVPLAPQERQPRLLVEQGSATERARVSLDWPYVMGPDSYGTFSVRYYADIDPAEQGGLSGRLLGGSVETAYLGGGFDHLFYSPTGAGAFRVFWVPSFLDDEAAGGREPARINFEFSWETGLDPAEMAGPAVALLDEPEDERRFGQVEFRTQLTQVHDDVSVTFLSRGFFDLHPGDSVRDPSWFDRRNPRRTLLDFSVTPTDPAPLILGPLRLSRLLLELGVFEDTASPAMRARRSGSLLQAARLHEQHSLELTPLPLWSGFELRGQTAFGGYYYSTGQRMIDWNTRVTGTQRLGAYGQLNLTFTRDVTEGETPFRFDQLTLRERSDVQGALTLTPLDWLSLSVRSGFVLTDSRNPRAEGWRPLESSLALFGNLSWLDVTFSNTRDLETGDPGNLATEVTLRTPGRGISASISAKYTHDLDPGRIVAGGETTNDTSTRVRGSVSTDNFRAEISWGHNFEPAVPADPETAPLYWEPFDVSLTIGSLKRDDRVAGFRVSYSHDLNEERPRALEYEVRFRLGELEVNANQRYRLPQGGTERSLLRVTWPGLLQLEATGLALIPGSWLGIDEPVPAVRDYTLSLTDAPQEGPQLWQVRWSTRFDPNLQTLSGGTGGRRNTTLELRALAEERLIGDTRFSVDLFVDIPLRDDQLASSYLRRANLTLGSDFQGRVGLQGTLGYRGTYSAVQDEVTRGELRIDGLALTVRVLDDLYLGAMLNDVWDLTGNNPEMAAFNLQPEFLLIWNRCCWALHGSWNSGTGQVRIALTTPGADTGLVEVIDTPLQLPGRHGEARP
jgi:hypothetical protein